MCAEGEKREQGEKREYSIAGEKQEYWTRGRSGSLGSGGRSRSIGHGGETGVLDAGEKWEQDAPTVGFCETPETPETPEAPKASPAPQAYADLAKSALHVLLKQCLRPRFVNQIEQRFDIAQ